MPHKYIQKSNFDGWVSKNGWYKTNAFIQNQTLLLSLFLNSKIIWLVQHLCYKLTAEKTEQRLVFFSLQGIIKSEPFDNVLHYFLHLIQMSQQKESQEFIPPLKPRRLSTNDRLLTVIYFLLIVIWHHFHFPPKSFPAKILSSHLEINLVYTLIVRATKSWIKPHASNSIMTKYNIARI